VSYFDNQTNQQLRIKNVCTYEYVANILDTPNFVSNNNEVLLESFRMVLLYSLWVILCHQIYPKVCIR